MRVTILVLVALAALCACGGPAHEAASSAAAPSSSASTKALTCGTVVDTGPRLSGTWTAEKVIAQLGALMITDGAAIKNGHLTSFADGILAGADHGLGGNREPGKLESDAQDYAAAEQNYDPDGPVVTVFAQALKKDIAALEKDCPGSIPQANKLAGAS
jgi:hypothetical protein